MKPTRVLFLLPMLLTLVLWSGPAAAASRLSDEQVLGLLKEFHKRRQVGGDLKRLAVIQESQRKQKVVREAIIYERESNNEVLVLFTGPKTVQGNGYLRVENNLWFYDSTVGKWERRTERERLAGTNVRQSDFGGPPLHVLYDGKDEGEEQLNGKLVRKIVLSVKKGVDVAFPVVKMWVDKDLNEVKREEYALSGKLLRTAFLVKPAKVVAQNNRLVWLPGEVRIFDEVEKDRKTTMVFKAVDLGPLPPNQFTKAWLEGKVR